MLKYLIAIAGLMLSCSTTRASMSVSVEDGIGSTLLQLGIPFTGAVCIVHKMDSKYTSEQAIQEFKNLLNKEPSPELLSIFQTCRKNWELRQDEVPTLESLLEEEKT